MLSILEGRSHILPNKGQSPPRTRVRTTREGPASAICWHFPLPCVLEAVSWAASLAQTWGDACLLSVPSQIPDAHACLPPAARAGSASQLSAEARTWRLKLLTGVTLGDLMSSIKLSGPMLQAQPCYQVTFPSLTPFLDTFPG